MLGLPDSITTCLFDLDGVLTQTAKVHAEAWKQTFDEYLRARAKKTGEEFKEFDKRDDYDKYVDGLPRYDGVRNFLKSRGIELPEGSPDDPPDKETICGIGNRKNELVLKLIKEQGVEPYEGSVRYVKAARDAGLHRAVVSSSTNCKDVLVAAGIDDLFEARIDGKVADEQHLKGKPAPDTFLAGAKALGVEPAQAAVFEDALAGVQAGRAGQLRLRGRRRPRGPGRRAARSTVPTSSSRTSTSCLRIVIKQPGVPGRAVGGARDRAGPGHLAQTESVFALANGHVGLRGNLDEGEPYGIPGTYLGGFYEVRPLPYAEAGYGYPEDGQTVVNVTNGKIIRLLVEDEPFDVRYGALHSHERVLDLRAGVLRRTAEWESPTGRKVRVSLHPAGLVHAARGGGDRVHRRGRRGCVPGRRPIRAGRQRAAARRQRRPARRRRAGLAAGLRRVRRARRRAGDPGPPHPAERAARGRRDGSSGRGPGRHRDRLPRRSRTSRASQVTADLAPGKPLRIVKLVAYGWSAQRSAPALRDQVAAAGCRRHPHRLGRACWPSSARTWTTSGSARTSRSRATPSSSRRCASRSFTPSRPAPAASSARSPPRG